MKSQLPICAARLATSGTIMDPLRIRFVPFGANLTQFGIKTKPGITYQVATYTVNQCRIRVNVLSARYHHNEISMALTLTQPTMMDPQ